MVTRTAIIFALSDPQECVSPLTTFAGKALWLWPFDVLSKYVEQTLIVTNSSDVSAIKEASPHVKIIQARKHVQFDLYQSIANEIIGDQCVLVDCYMPAVASELEKLLNEKNAVISPSGGQDGTFRQAPSICLRENLKTQAMLQSRPEAPSLQGAKHIEVKSWCCQRISTLREKVELEKRFYLEYAHVLLNRGVEVRDPHRFVVMGELSCEPGVVIEPGCSFIGNVDIKEQAIIESGCVIKQSRIEKKAQIHAYTIIENSVISEGSQVGPFAHIQHSHVGDHCVLGNYVEAKRSKIGSEVKAKHFCYLGDGQIGQGCNIGAGTIFCNYNGVKKYPTTIGEYAFIGAHVCLIAPIGIGSHALVGAGSVITKEVGVGEWVVCRAQNQKTIRKVKAPY